MWRMPTARAGWRPQQVVRDHLHALIGPMGPRPMRPGQRVTRRRGEPLRPENGRCVEDKVPLRARVYRGGPLLRGLAADPGRSGRHDLEARHLRRVAVVLPADQSRNPVAVLHPGAFKHPVLGLRDDPVAATVDRLDVSSPHEQALVRSMFWERAVLFLPAPGVVVIGPIRAATKNDPVGPAVVTVAVGRDPANCVA